MRVTIPTPTWLRKVYLQIMIEVKNLDVIYRDGTSSLMALQEVNLDVASGETCAVIGPSGCGKTTLLYVLAGLLKPAKGEVIINDGNMSVKSPETAVILQDYGLLPWQTVWENTVLGLKIRRRLGKEAKREVRDILDRLELLPFCNYYPSQLSGGQRQRVAIARALSLRPGLLLMDEPFSSLDAITRESLQELLLKIWRDTSLTILMVTHNIEEAVFLGQKILVMSPGPGRVLENIENPYFSLSRLRFREEFHLLCSRVREVLEEGKNGWREPHHY